MRIAVLCMFAILMSCSGEERFIPKPPTFLRISLPEVAYIDHTDTCGVFFEIPSYASIKTVPNSCNKDISLGELNGMVHLSFIEMDTSLAAYVNYAIDKVDEHKIKAIAIKDTNIIEAENDVYGTFFSLEGNVATPFQFYVTDSSDHFLSGVVYFNAKPNYDSIKPVLNYVKKDLIHLLKTTRWK